MLQRLLSLLLLVLMPVLAAGEEKAQREERSLERYFKKWLEEDVVYIITDEERDVFNKLTTPEEKEKFIEQFWIRRDPTPGTVENEFKEEHYRRLSYANKRFASGKPGWKTDRGRIYIKFGEPDEIDSHPVGGQYLRQPHEGGGSTATYPFEVWRYRYIEGLGQDIEFEFVDRSWSGEYTLAKNYEEKDLFLYVDGLGLTLREYLGLETRLQRLTFSPGNAYNPVWAGRHYQRSKDQPFARLGQYFATQRPPEIKFKDLRAVVETKITYNHLPFQMRQDLIRLDSERWLVPITIEINNQDLKYERKQSVYNAKVNVYGIVTGINGRAFAEFEDTLNSDYTQEQTSGEQKQRAIYQKMVALPPGLYKLDLVVRDVYSGKMGTWQGRIEVPRIKPEEPAASTLVLARSLATLSDSPQRPMQFVIGDVKVVPNVSQTFGSNSIIGVYMQAYNIGIDQATGAPSLEIEYQIVKDGKVVQRIQDPKASSVYYFSEERLVLVKGIALRNAQPGAYKLRVVLQDNVRGNRILQEADFKVAASQPVASSG